MTNTGSAHISFEEHKKIYESIKSRDPQAAEHAMRVHVENAKERLAQLHES